MQKKIEEHIFQGMQRDMSISKQKPEFLWNAHNVRLTTRHGETLLSMTNERGTKKYSDVNLKGVVLGYCVLGNYLTVFTTDINPSTDNSSKPDYIYRLEKNDNSFDVTILYNGNLNFNIEYPIECLGVYENEDIQKIYWTDGRNQPRFINIKKKDNVPASQADAIYNETSFDFIPTLSLKDSIYVKKVPDSSGLFPAGVIQYAVTYYNKYGQESNISVVSPLIPTSYTSRAGSPEETIGNAFKITVKYPDTQFEYLRLYSIFRSSKNTTPVCKRVADVRLGYGGNTSGKVYVSEDSFNRRYARIDVDKVYFKPDYDSLDFIKLLDGATYGVTLCQDTKTVDGITFNGNTYYHFSKNDYPNLLIKAYTYSSRQNPKEMFFTWGYCTDIYISTECVEGPETNAYPIIWAAGGSSAKMLIASDIHYQYETFIHNNSVTITDNNTNGEDVDYNELLFVGGEEITAGTLTQKDGTMFLGDIRISRPLIEGNYSVIDVDTLPDDPDPQDEDPVDGYITTELAKTDNRNAVTLIRKGTSVSSIHRVCEIPLTMNSASYKWGNTLNAYIDSDSSTNVGGFKHGEHYRLGLQFQYKTGKWSQPVFIKDKIEEEFPSLNTTQDPCIQNVPGFMATLDHRVGKYMLDNGYQRVRAVVCFPTESDQLILCQGLLNPTVHSIAGRLNHTPDVLSSWFFRPIPEHLLTEPSVGNGVQWADGKGIIQYKNKWTLHSGVKSDGTWIDDRITYQRWPTDLDEIQGSPVEFSNKDMSNVDYNQLTSTLPDIVLINNLTSIDQTYYNEKEKELVIKGLGRDYDTRDLTNVFVVDWEYLTFHSPEFEFNDSFNNVDTTTFNCRLSGRHLLAGSSGDIHIMTSSGPIASDAPGFYHVAINTHSTAFNTASRITTGLFYRDAIVKYNSANSDFPFEPETDIETDGYVISSFLVYPWHRTGSLNNDCVRSQGTNRTAMLSLKKMTNIMYFEDVAYAYPMPDDPSEINNYLINDYEIPLNNTDIKIFRSDLMSLVKVNNMNYFGNIDSVLSSFAKYHIGYSAAKKFEAAIQYRSTYDWNETDSLGRGLFLTSDPVYMKYKSTPHAVIHTDYNFDSNSALRPGYLRVTPEGIQIDDSSKPWPYLYCAEMYRELLDTDFGGTSEMAIHNNIWYPAGPAVQIGHDADGKKLDIQGHVEGSEQYQMPENVTIGLTQIPFWYGDTYFQRYDCLKTYPFTDEDINSIIEIGSFMVETRINLDGRYDKNRGSTLNFMLNPTNFNLINLVYSQMDNFFNYRILDDDYYSLNKYPTMVSWTGYKNNAAEVDSWTNITLASTLEMDGTKGKVNAVRVNSDQLYCFQDDAIGQILFNSRVQISPSDGVPIEISNNYKVDGNRYISTSIGCKNKWSIIEGIDGLYFIDDNTKALYLLAQGQLKPISTPLNMSYWFMNQDTGTPWIQRYWQYSNVTENETTVIKDWETPQQGIRCFYDNANADLYICTPKETLCYSEKLGQFVSFFDYHNVIGMFNIDSDYYALNYSEYNSALSGVKLWGMFKGMYNTIFDEIYPSDFTFISNENPLNDKIFTNIELRGDFRWWNGNEPIDNAFESSSHKVNHDRMFDTVRVWNEYQDTARTSLVFTRDIVTNMKKKFRIWRMDIPRDTLNPRQRIRNTWCKVQFTMNNMTPISLENLCNRVSSEYMVHNENNSWGDLDFRNTETTRFEYISNGDYIIEKCKSDSVWNDVAFYRIEGNIITKTLFGETTAVPYAYRKIYDMEIHDVGVVYFV